jgi:DNA-binding winged helix-turn-helix (wHTH) protein
MPDRERYAFHGWTLDVSERRLRSAQQPVPLPAKAYDVLVTLVRSAGRLVSRRELLARVWADSFVDAGILAVHVSGLRKALGDDRQSPKYIETVQSFGYRFIAPVVRLDERVARSRRRQVAEHLERGKTHVLSASRFELPRATASFRAALALDATDAAAYAGLAVVRCGEAALHVAAPASAYGDARTAALRALALDQSCADAHAALGAVMFLSEWDWVAAERSLRRALALDPGHTLAALLYGRLLEAFGQSQNGLAMKRQALEHAPASPLVHLEIAMSYYNQRCYDQTVEWARKTLRLDARHLLAREVLAAAFIAQGVGRLRRDEVVQPRAGLLGRAECYADGVLQEALQPGRSQPLDVPELHRAVLHSAAGEMDRAFRHLNRAIDGRDPGLLRLSVAPQWDNLRGDSRFDRCLARVGLDAG